MPAVNALETGPMTPRVDRPRLKAHKALPRKRDILPAEGSISIPPPSSPRPDATPPPNGFAYPTAPALPLTPPGLPSEPRKESNHDISQGVSQEFVSDTAGTATPAHQLSPLTPDITPPRVVSQFKKREGLTQIQPSMSSRDDSFATAREALSSEEDEVERRNAGATPLLRPTKHRFPHPLRTNTSPNDPELSKNEGAGHVADSKTLVHQTNSATSDSLEERRIKPHENSVGRSHKKKHKRKPILADHDPFSPQDGNSPSNTRNVIKSPLNRERSLKERIQDSRSTPASSSVEKFAQEIGWISGEEKLDMSERIHSWRLSGMSTTSTVEAMVIDSPPRKQPTLRHTEKNSSLRSASSPIPKSPYDDSASSLTDHHRRLLRKSARITNENRWSVSTDMSFAASVTSARPKPKQEVVPVVVIPQRRSSLKSTNSCSRNNSQTRSIDSGRRPTTAPDSATRQVDKSREKRRTLSESLPSKDATRNGRTFGPTIPQRRSSLSAPTSRNNSRAPSLTSESLRHYAPAPNVQPVAPEPRDQVPKSTQNPIPEPVTQFATLSPLTYEPPGDENGLMISPSLRLTPFQPSIQSLSPGPVEIHEARAVPFFFHNNKSLLLVDQLPATESRAVQELRTLPVDMEMRLAQPQTPETRSQVAVADVDSPLRNPRAPPKPPAVKVIPPTPMDELNRPLVAESSNSESNNGRVRRLSSVRRAFSSRRRAEAYAAPFPNHHVRNPKVGKNIDSKLHPFWMPRPFWEGFVDSDGEGEGNARSVSPLSRTSGDLYVSNSLGIPQKRVIFAGPLSVIRRMSNRSRYRAAKRNSASQEVPSRFKTGFPPRRARQHRHYMVPTMGFLQVPIRSLRELQEWLAQIRRQREQDKLEERRDKIRKSIRGRVLMNNTATIVPDGR
ncbi:hypothetical protein AJ79_10253 [Helicocarpus griseus UAMH5409]|uniref:Uncharacterized protein n=1 Tax=Helicocarpus griseus UAMH5409 TaxID=1447875 RepID=A0A2B7WF25_9EURO|nr:hypothetical protein AJ79_10253 [Helicocarpus griseus UAMH5409]